MRVVYAMIDFSKLTEEMIDDISFIREIKHTKGKWQQYDVLLAAKPVPTEH